MSPWYVFWEPVILPALTEEIGEHSELTSNIKLLGRSVAERIRQCEGGIQSAKKPDSDQDSTRI